MNSNVIYKIGTEAYRRLCAQNVPCQEAKAVIESINSTLQDHDIKADNWGPEEYQKKNRGTTK